VKLIISHNVNRSHKIRLVMDASAELRYYATGIMVLGLNEPIHFLKILLQNNIRHWFRSHRNKDISLCRIERRCYTYVNLTSFPLLDSAEIADCLQGPLKVTTVFIYFDTNWRFLILVAAVVIGHFQWVRLCLIVQSKHCWCRKNTEKKLVSQFTYIRKSVWWR